MIRWGFCIPRECTGKDLENAIYEKLQIPSRIRPTMCQTAKQQQPQLTYGDIFARYFFFSIAVAIGLSTFLYSNNKLENTGIIFLFLLLHIQCIPQLCEDKNNQEMLFLKNFS